MKISKAFISIVLFILFLEIISVWSLLTEQLGFQITADYYLLIDGFLEVVIILFFVKAQLSSGTRLIQKTSLKWYGIALLSGIVFIYLQTVMNWIYNPIFGTDYTIVYDYDGWQYLDFFIVGTVFFIPIAEELFFRRYLQNELQKKYRPVVAILFSALLFAFIHLPLYSPIIDLFYGTDYGFSIHHAYLTFGGGLISAILYYLSKSVGPSILMHAMWNFMVAIA